MRLCLTSSPAIATFTWQFGLSSAKILQFQHRGTDKSCAGLLPSLVLGLASALQLTHIFLSFPFPGPFSSCPTTFHHHSPPCTNSPFTGRAVCDALLCSHSLCPALFCKLSHKNNKITINRTIEQDTPELTGEEQNSPERKVGDGLVMSQPAFPQSHVLLLQQQPSPLDTLSPSLTSLDTSHW